MRPEPAGETIPPRKAFSCPSVVVEIREQPTPAESPAQNVRCYSADMISQIHYEEAKTPGIPDGPAVAANTIWDPIPDAEVGACLEFRDPAEQV